jgi:hypothetical protein
MVPKRFTTVSLNKCLYIAFGFVGITASQVFIGAGMLFNAWYTVQSI